MLINAPSPKFKANSRHSADYNRQKIEYGLLQGTYPDGLAAAEPDSDQFESSKKITRGASPVQQRLLVPGSSRDSVSSDVNALSGAASPTSKGQKSIQSISSRLHHRWKNLFSKTNCSEPVESIRFYRADRPYFDLGNFGRVKFTLDGQEWPTSEHYYQSQKFIHHPELQEKIRKTASPTAIYHLAHKHSAKVRPDWETVKDQVMRQAVVEKFRQNEDARLLLLSTGSLKLIESSPTDTYWGEGANGSGQNRLGQILEETREQLKLEFPRYAQQLEALEYLVPVAKQKDSYLLTPYPRVLHPLLDKLRSSGKGEDAAQYLQKAVREIPGFEKDFLIDNQYAFQGMRFLLSTQVNQSGYIDVLKKSRQLRLNAMPQLVETINVDPYYCVVVSSMPGEASAKGLIPYIGNEKNVSSEVARKFFKELEQLSLPSKSREGRDLPGYYVPSLSSKEPGLLVSPGFDRMYLNSLKGALPMEPSARGARLNETRRLLGL